MGVIEQQGQSCLGRMFQVRRDRILRDIDPEGSEGGKGNLKGDTGERGSEIKQKSFMETQRKAWLMKRSTFKYE